MSYTVEIRTHIASTIDGINLIPHTFIIITDPDGVEHGYGFAPEQTGLFGVGVIHDDTDHAYNASSGVMTITQAQYDQLNNYTQQPPPPYALPFGAQCTTWALEGLANAGIIPSILTPDTLPNPLFFTDILETIAFNPYTQAIGFEIYGVTELALNALIALGNGNEWRIHINELVDTFFRSSAKYVQPVRRDPLTLDLDGDGLETVGTTAGILFDQTGNGVKTGTGWVKSDDGLLVLDRNGNGTIDNGRELFGDSTIKSNGQLATDGFDALRDLDSNGNGKIDAGDAQFNNLRVWRDLNQDGTTQTGELFTLNQLNIASINVSSTDHSQTLANGNQVADLGTFTRTDGSTGTTGEVTGNLGDINLAQDTFHRQFTSPLDTSAVAALPDMQGSGAVRDLREAASQSPELAATLGQLGGNTTRAELKAAVGVILQQWADGADFTDSFEAAATQNKDLFFIPPGVSALDAYNAHYYSLLGTYYGSTSGGTPSGLALTGDTINRFDTIRTQQANIERMLKTLETFNGRDFVPIVVTATNGGSNLIAFATGTPDTSTGGGAGLGKTPALYNMEQARLDLLTQSYNQLVDSVYSALVTQTRMKPYMDAISLKIGANGISLDFSGCALGNLREAVNDCHWERGMAA